MVQKKKKNDTFELLLSLSGLNWTFSIKSKVMLLYSHQHNLTNMAYRRNGKKWQAREADYGPYMHQLYKLLFKFILYIAYIVTLYSKFLTINKDIVVINY